MPAAISPTAARRCCNRAFRSSRRTSVTSWNVKRNPARPSGKVSGLAVRPRSIERPSPVRCWVSSLGDARTLRIDTQHRTGDGRSIDLGLTASPLTFPDGRAGFLYTFQDVTDVRRLERNARLQQRLAAVGEMAAGIAHEIRNPLASMSGSIQVLRHELILNDEQAQLMDIVLRESERLNETIKSFLAYARPQRFALAKLDIRKIVQDAALLLRKIGRASCRERV